MPVLNQYTGLNNNPQFGGRNSVYTGIYSADPDIAAQGAQSLKQVEAQGNEARKTAAQAEAARQGRFNTLLPMFQGAMGGGNFNIGGQGIDVPKPQFGGPHIQGGPLWTQQGIQQNLNANRAMIDRSTATMNRDTQNQAAGRGFGARSPTTMALQNQANMSALGQKADYTRQFLPQARQANAQFGLQAANAQQNQFAQNQNAMLGYGQNLLSNQANQIRAQGQNQQFQSSLLGALGGLMG